VVGCQDLIIYPTTSDSAPSDLATSTDAASPVVTSPSATLEEEDEDEGVPEPSIFQFLFGLFIFVGAGGALFIWLGGLRYVRRGLGMPESAGYRKVDEEDPEK